MKATLTTDIERSKDIPGAYTLFVTWDQGDRIAGMSYVCPCGCGSVGEIRFTIAGRPPRSPTYLWDLNQDAPTVSPEIRHVVAGHTCWVGILQAGVWHGEPQNDSGAAQAPSDPTGA